MSIQFPPLGPIPQNRRASKGGGSNIVLPRFSIVADGDNNEGGSSIIIPNFSLALAGSSMPQGAGTLQAWFRADLGVTQVANVVSAWADQSQIGDSNRNLSQATSTARPTLHPSDAAYNNQATIAFNASLSQFLQSGTWSAALAQPCTIFVVGNTDGTNANQTFCDDAAGTGRVLLETNYNSTSHYELYAGSFMDSTVAYTSSPVIFGAIVNGNSSKTFLSADTATATGAAGAHALQGLTLGAAFSGGAPLNGKIAEFLAFSGALSQPNINKVMAYLGARYSITVGP